MKGAANDHKAVSLSKDKAELLRALKERGRKPPRIERCEREGMDPILVPASWAQQRLWFVNQLEQGGAGYQIPLAIRLQGTLMVDCLRSSLNALVERHEALRTTFVSQNGEPWQAIAAHAAFDLLEFDLSGVDSAQQDRNLHALKHGEAHAKFDLNQGPLLRGRLVRLAPEEHVLLVTMHHIISDGWSLGVFFHEMCEAYRAFSAQQLPTLEPLRVQYADYAQWQRQWLSGETLEKQLDYWRTRLQGAAPQLELPTDRARPNAQSYRGGNLRFTLKAEIVSSLKQIAQRHEMTLFMLLYAGWALLLSRLTNQEDIVVGSPIANRQQPELEGLIGFFVNTLVLRVGVRPEMAVDELLEQVKEVALGAYDHQDAPFEKLVEMLQPERMLGRNPIFQVMFAFQSAPRSELQLPQLSVTFDEGIEEPSIFDLFVSMEELGAEIVASVSYAADLFDRQTILDWMSCFEQVLEQMLEMPTAKVGDLQVVPDPQLRRISAFNETHATFSEHSTVHQLFERQARLAPDAVALVHEGSSLTYAELNGKADQLARLLRAQGIAPDRLVALCVDRGVDMIVGILGILKAGGAYVPVDPNYPAERIKHMLEEAAPSLVLTQRKLRGVIEAESSKIMLLDDIASELASVQPSDLDAPEPSLTSAHLVYVIYTSGSTGRPKGIAMIHRAMVNLLEWHARTLPPTSSERVLQFAALSFDVAFQEIFSTLSSGATLVLLDEWVRRDARALTELLIDRSVTRLFVPPLMLQSLAEEIAATGKVPGALRDIITAGEQLRVSAEIVSLFDRLPGARLHNHYGPTETHVVTALTLEGPPSSWPVLPSIGRPIANTEVHVLDARRQTVPVGVIGEVYIGGANLARGYLKRFDMTQERFVSDRRGRLYRTGDVGRWRADGTIEYLGRNDEQVKVRGFRIELGEIEAQLARHPSVQDAAVVASNTVGGRRLVAYVQLRQVSNRYIDELRAHLRAALPEHMIPSAFMVLEKFPLTPSGKLDRRSLPAPDADAYVKRQHEAPQGQIEESLAEIWKELLGAERVGRADNFFELGGHSLLATRLISRVRERMKCDVPIRVLFDAPTLQQFAEAVEADSPRPELVHMDAEERVTELRHEIDELGDEEVLARLAELEREASATEEARRHA